MPARYEISLLEQQWHWYGRNTGMNEKLHKKVSPPFEGGEKYQNGTMGYC
jgi:hypothetical protein